MKPSSPYHFAGWNAPTRGSLIVLMAILASNLAWVTRRRSVEDLAVPRLMVDVNSAPEPVLLALPGLGPTLSKRIIEGRPFRSLAEIDRRVSGIGPAKSAALRPYLRFDPSSIP